MDCMSIRMLAALFRLLTPDPPVVMPLMLIHKHKHYPLFFQGLSSWSSDYVGLGSLSQELRVHLNHWSCLFSKVKSDDYLRPVLVQQTWLLDEIRHTLDLLSLQAQVLMERYVSVILSATAQTDLHSVPRGVLEDIVAGTELYNQAVEEQRAQRCATQMRTAVLQRAHYNVVSSLPTRKGHHPTAFSVRELTMILAVHHAEMAAKELHCWASKQSYQICPVHSMLETSTCSDKSVVNCGTSTLRSEWTWDKLQHTYLNKSSLLSVNHHPSYHTCYKTPLCTPDLHLDCTDSENHHPVLSRPQINQCQAFISQYDLVQTSEDALDSVQRKRVSSHHRSAPSLLEFCQQDRSSVELLFEVLVSSSDLLAPLVSHTPTPGAPPKQLLPNTITDVSSVYKKTEPVMLTGPIINTADSLELSKEQTVDETLQECAEVEISTRPETAGR